MRERKKKHGFTSKDFQIKFSDRKLSAQHNVYRVDQIFISLIPGVSPLLLSCFSSQQAVGGTTTRYRLRIHIWYVAHRVFRNVCVHPSGELYAAAGD